MHLVCDSDKEMRGPVLVAADPGTLDALGDKAAAVVKSVPDCVGVTVSVLDGERTAFTLLASDSRLRMIDAAQYLSGGPALTAASTGEDVDVPDVWSQQRWRLFAMAAASTGVQTSLSMVMGDGQRTIGSVNFFASQPETFFDQDAELAEFFTCTVESALIHADLSIPRFTRIQRGPETLPDVDMFRRASAIIAAAYHTSTQHGMRQLRDAARRAGTSQVALAQLVITTDQTKSHLRPAPQSDRTSLLPAPRPDSPRRPA